MRTILVPLALVLALAACGRGQSQPDAAERPADAKRPVSMKAVTIARIQARNPGTAIKVISAAVGADGVIGPQQSGYGANRSLPVSWTVAAGAQSYALVIEDPDAPGGAPFVHWLIWNIPGDRTSLPEGLPNTATLAAPEGALQGRNDAGSSGYFGPRPPPGPAHHYHVQVFALDRILPVPAGAELPALREAMTDHVLASGDLIGTYKAPRS